MDTRHSGACQNPGNIAHKPNTLNTVFFYSYKVINLCLWKILLALPPLDSGMRRNDVEAVKLGYLPIQIPPAQHRQE